MNTRASYILFGSTNGYQASRNATFNGRTRIAHSVAGYMTAQEASEKLLGFLCEENDNHHYDDAGNVVIALSYDDATDTEVTEVVGSVGDLSYEYDGYGWEYIALDDLTEEDAKLALDSGRLSDMETEEVYNLHEILRPEVEDADGE